MSQYCEEAESVDEFDLSVPPSHQYRAAHCWLHASKLCSTPSMGMSFVQLKMPATVADTEYIMQPCCLMVVSLPAP